MLETKMSLALFYRGLLYALREKGDTFTADGKVFHAAFRRMLEKAKEKNLAVPADEMLEQFDPIFGVSPHATEMVFVGERDYLLSLMNPRLVKACFKISDSEATEALNRLSKAADFRTLAADLVASLQEAATEPQLV